jgi:hypothetical protein
MHRLLREPLLHFAVLGAALFVADGVLRPGSSDATEIVVSAGQLEAIEAQFRATRQRPPSEAEMQALVEHYVREEVMFREGIALGLDRDDPVIRNRVKQKMEFVGEDTLALEPTDADLAAYLEANREQFEIPAAVSFEQIFFDPERRGPQLERDLAASLAGLRDGRRADRLGDATLLTRRMEQALPREVSAAFGAEFAAAVAALPTGTWQGPVRSSFGIHLVRVSWRGTATMPTLAEAREEVAREWTRARSLEMREQFYSSLRARYTVSVEAVAPSNARAGTR